MNRSKQQFYGIGPKLAWVMLPLLAITITLSLMHKGSFAFSNDPNISLPVSGLILLVSGFVIYFTTLPHLLRGIRESRLVTDGAFRLSVNPLYASIIVLMLPGISLIMNSWLILTVSVVSYAGFRFWIIAESREMEKIFGDSYIRYRKETPEFFPFSLSKNSRNK